MSTDPGVDLEAALVAIRDSVQERADALAELLAGWEVIPPPDTLPAGSYPAEAFATFETAHETIPNFAQHPDVYSSQGQPLSE